MPPKFACDPAHHYAVPSLLEALRRGPEYDWFALLDTAFDHGADHEEEKSAFPIPPEAVNCYAGIPILEEIAFVAPVLIPLPPRSAAEQIANLVAHCSGRPMLSFLATERGFTAEMLAEQWKSLHWVYPEDGGRFLLRFADCRSLGILPEFMEAVQWQAFHDHIHEWYNVTRTGYPDELSLKKTGKRLPHRIDLTEKQFARMVAFNEIDNAFAEMSSQQPCIIPEEMSGSRFFLITSRTLHEATNAGSNHWGDKMILTALAVLSDGEILEDPEVEAWIQAKGWEEGQIAAAIRAAPCFERWRQGPMPKRRWL